MPTDTDKTKAPPADPKCTVPPTNPRHALDKWHVIIVHKPPEDMTEQGRPEIRGHTFAVNGVNQSILYGEPVAVKGQYVALLDHCKTTRYSRKIDAQTKKQILTPRVEPRFTYTYEGTVDEAKAHAINTRNINDPPISLY